MSDSQYESVFTGVTVIYLWMMLDRLRHPQLGLIAEIFMQLGEEEK